jgi:hypothetical protein
MNRANQSGGPRTRRNYTVIFEILLVVMVTPALVYGVSSLNNLPVA